MSQVIEITAADAEEEDEEVGGCAGGACNQMKGPSDMQCETANGMDRIKEKERGRVRERTLGHREVRIE